MNRTEIINGITRIAEQQGWDIECVEDIERKTTLVGFYQFTPQGQDFYFDARMQADDLDTFIHSMTEYIDAFDVDEETYLWLDSDGHGKNGAPYRMRDVLDDMEAAERMMNDLLETIIQWSKQHDE